MTPAARALLLAIGVTALAGAAHAQVSPVLMGDPVDGLGRALPILPGVPLITANEDGDFNPPVVDPGTIGDVDIVVRAGHVTPGPTMPPPALVPPAAGAGGSRFPGGTDVPFTVIASDGDPTLAGGHPLLGPELDGIPVLVLAFADLDGDGVVGPTNADGVADNARELQESEFPVGMRVAYFTNGVAQGVIASDVGAPGGLPVVLTAAAYIGQFSPDFFLGTVPDGPAVTTLQPFFPRLEPDRVIDTDGSAGPALPDGRIGVEFESEFEPPVNDPLLGSVFALPVDGSSVTVDRALIGGGRASRGRFVQPSSPAGLTGEEPRLSLRPGAGGELFEPLAEVSVDDDGPGGGVAVRLVPVDVLGNITDPATPLAVDLTARFGAAIATPDVDGDPAHESVSLADGAGILVTIDDSGGENDSGGHGTVVAAIDGFGVEQLFVRVDPGPPAGTAPTILDLGIDGGAEGISLACPTPKTFFAAVSDADDDAIGVTAIVSQDDVVVAQLDLAPSSDPGIWTAPLPPAASFHAGFVIITATARDARGNHSESPAFALPAADSVAPTIDAVSVTPSSGATGKRVPVTVSARVLDDCGVRRVWARLQAKTNFKRFSRLNDRGKKADPIAGDGVFSGGGRWPTVPAAARTIEIVARNSRGLEATLRATIPRLP